MADGHPSAPSVASLTQPAIFNFVAPRPLPSFSGRAPAGGSVQLTKPQHIQQMSRASCSRFFAGRPGALCFGLFLCFPCIGMPRKTTSVSGRLTGLSAGSGAGERREIDYQSTAGVPQDDGAVCNHRQPCGKQRAQPNKGRTDATHTEISF